MFLFFNKNNTKMTSNATYYRTFISDFNLETQGVDFVRRIQSINREDNGFNLIIEHNKLPILNSALSYLFADKSDIIHPGINEGTHLHYNKEFINLNFPILKINLDKTKQLLKENRIGKFISNFEKTFKKSNVNHNKLIYSNINKYLSDTKHLISNTNLKNILVITKHIMLKLVYLFTYTKLLYEKSISNHNSLFLSSDIKVIKDLNNLINPYIQNVTNNIEFKVLKYNFCNKLFIFIKKSSDFFNYKLDNYKFNSQIDVVSFLRSLYYNHIINAFKSFMSFLKNLSLYFLISFFAILFLVIAIIIKCIQYLIVYIFF